MKNIIKKEFLDYYFKNSYVSTLRKFKLSPHEFKEIFDSLKLSKSDKWLFQAEIPEDVELDNGNSYRNKWRNYKTKPIERYFTKEIDEIDFLRNKKITPIL